MDAVIYHYSDDRYEMVRGDELKMLLKWKAFEVEEPFQMLSVIYRSHL